MAQAANRTAAEQIARYLEPHPARPGLAEWRLKERSVPVWAIVGALTETFDNTDAVAAEYGVSAEAVAAAIAFYEEHRGLIDARLAENVA